MSAAPNLALVAEPMTTLQRPVSVALAALSDGGIYACGHTEAEAEAALRRSLEEDWDHDEEMQATCSREEWASEDLHVFTVRFADAETARAVLWTLYQPAVELLGADGGDL